MKMLLFDLDGTLLRSDKTISARTLRILEEYRKKGIQIGISTSRSYHNCMTFLKELNPDLMIASGGALAIFRGSCIFAAEFSLDETNSVIASARKLCGADCEITVDTQNAHYWNYKVDPNQWDATWGETIYTDYNEFSESALKICVQILDLSLAPILSSMLPECDFQKFSGSPWHKITKKEATKENAIRKACKACGIDLTEVTAFGDDGPDAGMLRLCGTGVAMGNAIDSVKEAADKIIGSNDNDGIAEYLENLLASGKVV